MTAPAASARPEVVEEELLALYAAQGLRVPLPVTIGAALLAALLSGEVPRPLVWGWFALVVLVLSLRWTLLGAIARRPHWPLRLRLALATAMSGVGGLTHVTSVLSWPWIGATERLVLSMFILGLSSGALASTLGYLPVYAAYIAPMLVGLAIAWAQQLSTLPGDWYRGASGVLMVFFILNGSLLLVLARDSFRLHRENFEARRRIGRALEEAESANHAKTRFLASASHDLRQPMHTLTLFSAALSMRALDDGSRQLVQQMNDALQVLGSQLDTLLDISRLDAGMVPVRWTDVPLSALVGRIVDEARPLAQAKGLALALRAPDDVLARSDALLLERVLRNLVDNAIKYTDTGAVIVTIRADGALWRVSVEDTGPGIPEAERERVFEEFYQLGNVERDRRQGLGLGLSIVRRLCGLLEIDLAMHSELEVGTRFELRLHAPEVAPVPAPASGPIEPVAQAAPARPVLAGLRVLVLDDEESVRLGMQVLLESLGCEVAIAASTDEAMASCSLAAPDVALVDFRLRGGENGIDAIRRLRARHPALAALIVSGDTAPSRLREAGDAGLRLLHKPIQVEALMAAIRRAADENTPKEASHVAESGGTGDGRIGH